GLGDEGLADLAADLGADGDVLEVGVAGGEASGGGAGLVEAGMDALGAGVDGLLEGDEVGADELGELPVLDDQAGDGGGDGGVGAEAPEDLDVGGGAGLGALGDAQAQAGLFGAWLVEERGRELFGRVGVEAAADGLEGGVADLLAELVDAAGEALALAVELL